MELCFGYKTDEAKRGVLGEALKPVERGYKNVYHAISLSSDMVTLLDKPSNSYSMGCHQSLHFSET